MNQLELPLNTMFTVRVSCTADFQILADNSKQAVRFVQNNFFPQLTRPKIVGAWRAECVPVEVQETEDESGKTPPRPPRGAPPGGTPKGGVSKSVPPPADAVAA